MKTSLADPDPPPVDRSKAWSCLITNLLVMPGLGSVMARRKTAGYLQIVLSLAGFFITLAALIKFVLVWIHQLELPEDPALYHTGILGIVLFLAAWLWSLLTSLTLFRPRK